MIVIICLASLVTILVLILTTAVHFISILVDESDDDSATTGLGIDSHDFSMTPVASPNDNLLGSLDEFAPTQASRPPDDSQQAPTGPGDSSQEHLCNCSLQEQVGASETNIEVPALSLTSSLLTQDATQVKPIRSADALRARPEDVRTAEMNSQLIRASVNERDSSSGSTQALMANAHSSDSCQSVGSHVTRMDGSIEYGPASEWAQKTPEAHKAIITNQLGQAQSKQIIDDFDPKEMQLGGTGLHWCKSRKCLDKLIKLGVPTSILNKRGESAMHVAVRRHKLQILIGLLIYEADKECRNESGETPLIVACKANDIFAAQLLMIFDANFDAIDKWGYSARHYTAAICDRHKSRQQQQTVQQKALPSAAHLILAMLEAIGAKRCGEGVRSPPCTPPEGIELYSASSGNQAPPSLAELTRITNASTTTRNRRRVPCTEGCSPTGAYNGNSYNRWPNFERESLYKRHMFSDIIEAKLNEVSTDHQAEPAADAADSSQSSTFTLPRPSRGERKSRLLCIDGGGLRGVIVCQIMIELEKYLKRPMMSYFDWVGGTSVGAFMACALCRGSSLQEMRRVCFDVKDEVFSGGRPYNSKFLERVLKRTYGPTTRMSEVKGKKLAVTTVLADREPCQLRLFRNYESPGQLLEKHGYAADRFNNMSGHSVVSSTRETHSEPVLDESDPDPIMWQAVRASAAAPFFFRPYGPYLDGGIISNNPTLDMLSEFESYQKVRAFLYKHARRSCSDLGPADMEAPSELNLVVSLGTGRGRVISRQTMIDFGQVASGFATVFSPVELVRSIRAARDLFKKLMQQSCHTEDHILDRAQAWCSSLEIPYFRINPPLATIFSIDDKRDEQLINALWQTKLYMFSKRDQLRELGRLLDGNEQIH